MHYVAQYTYFGMYIEVEQNESFIVFGYVYYYNNRLFHHFHSKQGCATVNGQKAVYMVNLCQPLGLDDAM